MTSFNDLPLEVLPDIVQNVVQPRSLASFCLVNTAFCKFTQPFLYHTIAVFPWHHKEKIIKVFRTLSSSPKVAKHVRKLEIRDFPLGLDNLRLGSLVDWCLRGLENTVNLRCCIWTRDGTLRSSILFTILKHPSLKELEINGRQYGNYDERILPKFTCLRKIKLIMPTPPVVEILPAWLGSLADSLQNLSIVCRSSTAVTDALLEQISGNLSSLDELHLTGCRKVTHEGLVNALRHNKNGIKSLTIESVSPSFYLQEFDRQCRKALLLNHLTSLTITVNCSTLRSAWIKDIPSLVSSSPLECFQLYCTTLTITQEENLDEFVTTLLSTHGPRLKRFLIYPLPISMKAFYEICVGFSNLVHLFVFVKQWNLGFVGHSLSKATKLQAFHMTLRTLIAGGIDISFASPDDTLEIVRQCSSTLTQAGFGSRVWQVVREVSRGGKNRTTIAELAQYDQPEVPDKFRVL